MKRLLTTMSFLAILACSCNKPEETGPQEPESINSELVLSITASDLGGPWVSGASVSVLDETGNHEFTAGKGGLQAEFSGVASTNSNGRIVIYPNTSTAAFDLDSIRLDIPVTQRLFKPASAAWGNSTEFKMQDACAAIRFTTAIDNISMVEIEAAGGENLGGYIKLSVDSTNGNLVFTPKPTTAKITLLPPAGRISLEPGEHFVSCVPGSFASGFKLTATLFDGTREVTDIIEPATATAGQIIDLGFIEREAPDDAKPQEPERSEAFDINLVFIETPDATVFNWPFASPAMSSISGSYSVGKASFPEQKTALVLPEEAGGYTFQIFATTGVARNAGGGQGLKFGGAAGDYLQLPAIKGLCLTKVTLVSGGTCAAELVRYDGAEVDGGGPVPVGNSLAKGGTYTWYLDRSRIETAYMIRTVSATGLMLQKILLHYDVTGTPSSGEDPSSEFQEVLPDQIPDFSRVGYHWGDKAIPDVPVKMTLEAPADGSDALNLIQNAINTVETPGAILLKEGTYNVSDIINITRSGVVLRGEGESKTILYSTATTQQATLLQVGSGANKPSITSSSKIIAKYVPVGQMWVPVRDPEMFSVGETVWIYRPATEAWLDDLHMRELSLYNGTDWAVSDYNMYWERKVMKIEGYKIWLDNPVVMCIGGDKKYGEGYLCKGSWSRIEECGIENMTLDTRYDESKTLAGDFTDENHCWSGITVGAVLHGWIRNITTKHFGLSSVLLDTGSKNITVKNCTSLSPISSVEGSRRYAFLMNKPQQSLIENCLCDDDRHQYVTGGRVPGPNVFLRCTGTHSRSDAGPHQRWATGVLFDNVKVSDALNVQDRTTYGSGHGWTGVNFVCYNCEASYMCIQSPWVTGQNWAIGCIGTKVMAVFAYPGNLGQRPDGIWESAGKHVSPESLYESQLAERRARGEYIDK